jgi:hypothetical protein
MIDRFRDWCTQIASVALTVVTSFLLASFKTDAERKSFATKILDKSRFVHKSGDNFNTAVSSFIHSLPMFIN